MLKNMNPAPRFSAIDQDGQTIHSSDYLQQKNIVLYFYPKDDTPGCTIEANQFTALAAQFEQLDTVILGVSRDDCDSHQAFIKKFDLQLRLLADTDEQLCQLFDVIQEKEKNGVKKMGIVRSTFIIDKSGILQHALYGVTADGHAQEVLDMLRQLS